MRFGDLSKIRISQSATLGKSVSLSDGVRIGPNCLIDNLSAGKNSHIDYGVICTGFGSGQIKIGSESYVGIYNVLDWSSDIDIGDFVHIAGPSTALWTHSSYKMCINGIKLEDKDSINRPTAPIVIEDNSYIGCNCTIYPGVTIGHHSIVAPNSAVTKDVKPYTMVGGVPATLIKIVKSPKKN